MLETLPFARYHEQQQNRNNNGYQPKFVSRSLAPYQHVIYCKVFYSAECFL